MTQKPETVFKEHVRRDLAKLPHCWFEKIQQVCIRGTPDLLVCIAGFFVAIELKKDEKAKVDALQTHKLLQIEKAGGLAFIAYPSNWGEIYNRLTELAEGKAA
jgi:hypothetical protein